MKSNDKDQNGNNTTSTNMQTQLKELNTSDYKIAASTPDIIGWMVTAEQDLAIGLVKELLFDPEAMQVRYIVVALHRLTPTEILIPVGVAERHPEQPLVRLPGITNRQIDQLPVYTGIAALSQNIELETRKILEGTNTAPYLHPQFYQHSHFNEDRLYDKNTSREQTNLAHNETADQDRAERARRIVTRLDHHDQEIRSDVNRLKQVHELYQQSIWLDFIDRDIMRSGKLQKLISEDGIRGVTSNPAIFEQAISASADYDEDIIKLSANLNDPETIFYALAVSDIQQAADLFAPVYNDEVSGADGYVSLEVSPLFALDETATITQTRELWVQVARKNVMIKIPGTLPCLPAIKTAISEGININVTLLFGFERYEKVAYAYIEGLEERLSSGQDLSGIASVASFFLSRIDLLVDPLLEDKGERELKGMAAIASAKVAYSLYQKIFSGERWQHLAAAGAKPQRLLWASTGNKNPDYRDTRYIEELIGPDTVNTAPLATLNAFRDHGDAKATLVKEAEQSIYLLEAIAIAGIDMNAVATQLEQEGIQKFKEPYNKLLNAITAKITEQSIHNNLTQQTPMEISEKMNDVINDLIEINNDRVEGFEKAARDLEEQDQSSLKSVFNKLADESRQNVIELTDIVQRYGGQPTEGGSTSGALHRTWLDIKSVFTSGDREAILNECERGEDAIKAAYLSAIDPDNDLNPDVLQILQMQQQGIVEAHSMIKSLRDMAAEAYDETIEDERETDEELTSKSYQNEQSINTVPAYDGLNELQNESARVPEPESIEQEEEWQQQPGTSTAGSKLMEFFINELKDLLWAERELAETLPDMAEAATSTKLQAAFELHLMDTETHITRLEQIFGILGLEPESRKCEAMSGILDEGDEIISITDEGSAQRDVGLIFAGQKAEHYEIASYGGMIALAKTLGYYDIAETLALTLDEEKTADAKLTEIAESESNYAASTEPAKD